MSLATGYPLIHGDIKLVGYSVAGISTSIAMPEADVLFDVAQGLPYQTAYNTILLTHAHMDHASGLPYLISQKSMQQRPRPVIYMPHEAIDPLNRIMSIWHEIDQFEYAFDFKGVNPGERIPLKGDFFARTFATYHRVPSQGYTIFKTRKRLKTQYAKLSPHELGSLRREGTELDEIIEENLVSFTGDTTIDFLDGTGGDQAKNSKLLLMEVTYWDGKKSIENAREWGHIHFEELLPRLGEIKAERIGLIHISARYTTKMIREIIEDRVPEHIKPKLVIFPRPV
ncbi:MAG: MBL fold metallo-hydrolase [Bdellovibrionales bacterium]|jgi:ribonuclease Z|nr:MBL fold metallo-hydrolase [Bdellovibrionales bacterium]